MINQIYASSTGLYTIQFKSSPIHEGLTHDAVSDLMNYYRERYERMKDDGH